MFLDGALDIDQLADIPQVGIYELSAPYIIGAIAEQLRRQKKDDTSGIEKVVEKQFHLVCTGLYKKLKELAVEGTQVIPFFTVKDSHEIVTGII